jgi:hypothetical protein
LQYHSFAKSIHRSETLVLHKTAGKAVPAGQNVAIPIGKEEEVLQLSRGLIGNGATRSSGNEGPAGR